MGARWVLASCPPERGAGRPRGNFNFQMETVPNSFCSPQPR